MNTYLELIMEEQKLIIGEVRRMASFCATGDIRPG